MPRFKNTSLEGVFSGLIAEAPFAEVRLAEGFTRYAQNGAAHEAGFDAFMTGCIFSRFVNPPPSLRNMLPLPNTFFNVNLSGPDKMAEEDKVIYHCTFGSQWSVADVQGLFKEAAGEVRAKFLDARNCVVWVPLEHKVAADVLTRTFSRKNAGIKTFGFEEKNSTPTTPTLRPAPAPSTTPATTPSSPRPSTTPSPAPSAERKKVIVRSFMHYLKAKEPDYQSEEEEEEEDEDEEEGDEEEDDGDTVMAAAEEGGDNKQEPTTTKEGKQELSGGATEKEHAANNNNSSNKKQKRKAEEAVTPVIVVGGGVGSGEKGGSKKGSKGSKKGSKKGSSKGGNRSGGEGTPKLTGMQGPPKRKRKRGSKKHSKKKSRER